jgi:hypothetical protein
LEDHQKGNLKPQKSGIKDIAQIGGINAVEEINGQKHLEAQPVEILLGDLLDHADGPEEITQNNAQEKRQHHIESQNQVLH